MDNLTKILEISNRFYQYVTVKYMGTVKTVNNLFTAYGITEPITVAQLTALSAEQRDELRHNVMTHLASLVKELIENARNWGAELKEVGYDSLQEVIDDVGNLLVLNANPEVEGYTAGNTVKRNLTLFKELLAVLESLKDGTGDANISLASVKMLMVLKKKVQEINTKVGTV